jgi:uncharacterized protein (TIGR02391 family)
MDKINNQDVDSISQLLADQYLTGSKISRMLQYLQLSDPFPKNTKWKRISYAITEVASRTQSVSPLFKVIEYVANLSDFVRDPESWDRLLENVNSVLLVKGFQLQEDGKIHQAEAASTYSELQKRIESLTNEITRLELHKEVTRFCTKELIQKDYFHAVFEATKGLFDRIRTISELSYDGDTLIRNAFDLKRPIILIQGNMLTTQDEKNQYYGLVNSIKTCLYLYRNHQAHVPRLFDEISLKDSLRGLMILSLAHELLDKCVNIREFKK